MKYKIVEKLEEPEPYNNMPRSYRIEIEIHREEICLTREIFRISFRDGEDWDNFYFDNEMSWRKNYDAIGLSRATFITQNFNPQYLEEKEQELLKEVFRRLQKSEMGYKVELKRKNKELLDIIEFYKECQNIGPFLKFNRKQKVKKIL